MKPLVIIPYRSRPTHLECLVGQLQRHWKDMDICVCEQADDHVWNKGLLFNVAFKLLSNDYDYVILHDVDFIPVYDEVDYDFCHIPCMIAGAASQFDYKLYYPTFFGGVVICSKERYELVNGFPNTYRGYGGEDDGFRNSFVQKGIIPTYKMGRFECFAHPKPDIRPGTEFYNSADYQRNLKLATTPRDFSDGLSNCEQYYSGYYFIPNNNYKHLNIVTNG